MKLQKILELTTLSKKAVYFYIKEGLIKPTKNIDNGYYEFSEGDLRKLQVIILLRNIGMSIQDIKDLFIYPTLTNFFIHRQINNLKKSLYENINM
ncbi:MerR family transcriptional regulator [Clostridium saudiense]|nr:MerR family transcriptional regulator [Clostridium saudiense]